MEVSDVPRATGGYRCWIGLCAALVTTAGCGRSSVPAVPVNLTTALAIRDSLKQAGGEAGPAAVLAEPTGFAWIRGVVKVNGDVPPAPRLNVNKDVEVCGKMPLFDESVVVAGDRIKNVVVYLDTKSPPDDPRWEHPSFAAAKTAELAGDQGFDQKNCEFLTHVFAMRSTQRLEVHNSDPIGHNTNLGSTRGARPRNESITAGGSFVYDPGGESPAPFQVTCGIHPWMKAWLLTRDNPYFAVSADDGTFQIPDVPAGVELEFRLWQEKATSMKTTDATVTLNGQPLALSKGKFKLQLDPAPAGQEEQNAANLEIVINAEALQ